MQRLIITALLTALAPVLYAQEGRFEGPPGLQLYSLRSQFKLKGVARTLDTVKAFGIKHAELAGTYNMKPLEFKAELEARGITAVSGHFPYSAWKVDPEAVAVQAKELGLKFAGCAWADHKAPLDELQARDIVAVFNKAGAALAKHGITFFYHLHGFEFQPWKEGRTLADLIISETDPQQVKFQMDVLWIVFPGHDPVKLLEQYPGRWVSMHLKDLKKGVATGDLSGKTDVANDVTLGTGQMNWPAILSAAKKAGVQYYFIEDESPVSEAQIPESMKYLDGVRW
jgi:sugar phosphate isomerase/epimerase